MPSPTPKSLVSIVGTTATGKTKLGLKLAQRLLADKKLAGIDLISADSRQVYKGLEILSGADVPQSLDPKIKFHGVSIIDPDQEWSVFHFQEMALPIIELAWQANRLPIVVGGTGLYHKHLFNEAMEIQSAPDEDLRSELERLSVEELQKKLESLDAKYLESMNESDIKNPRRLIRAIERKSQTPNSKIFTSQTEVPRNINKPKLNVKVGLNLDLNELKPKIEQRVKDRFNNGALEEVGKLKDKLPASSPAMTATGVSHIVDYLDGKISAQECLDIWTQEEVQYAKRQITWWKKEPNIKWFSVADETWLRDATDYTQTQLFH